MKTLNALIIALALSIWTTGCGDQKKTTPKPDDIIGEVVSPVVDPIPEITGDTDPLPEPIPDPNTDTDTSTDTDDNNGTPPVIPDNASRFISNSQIAPVWSYLYRGYRDCISLRLLFNGPNHRNICFHSVGTLQPLANYSLVKISYKHNSIKFKWQTNTTDVNKKLLHIDELHLGNLSTPVSLTYKEKLINNRNWHSIGNIWMIIPLDFQNYDIETFNGKLSWSQNNKIIVTKGPQGSLLIFSYSMQ